METRLLMKEEDIVKEYREAKNKKEQIKILADENVCKKKDIIEVLERHGISTGEVKEKAGQAREAASGQEGIKPAAGLPEIVKDAVTRLMAEETEKMEQYQEQMLECQRNIREMNIFLQTYG